MHLTTSPRLLRPLFTSISLALLLAMPASLRAQAPDLTVTGEIAKVNRAWTWNLGATGMRGWIYNAWPATMNNDDCTLFAPYQILVTTVAANTPAAGMLAIDDVILGASAGTGAVPLFTADARKSLGWAIGDAEAGNGILKFKRWRAGVTTDVSITLPVMGSYSDTAPYSCPKSTLILANARTRLVSQLLANSSFLTSDYAGAISGLALLAGVAPGDPDYTTVQSRLQTYARALAAAGPKTQGLDIWNWGYLNLFLCEYYLSTGDALSLIHI